MATTINFKSNLTQKKINVLERNFKLLGSTSKTNVIAVSAKEIGISESAMSNFYYTVRKRVKFFQLSEEDGTKYPVNTKNKLREKTEVKNDNDLLKLVLSKLSKEDLADIILKSRQ